MKVKVAAATFIAANFMLSSISHAQYMPGVGLYGGNAPCGYAQGAAPGAHSKDDDIAELLLRQRSEAAKVRDLDARRSKKKEVIERAFTPFWAQIFLQHMEDRMNCSICGKSIAVDPTYPPRPSTGSPQPDPRPSTGSPTTDPNLPPIVVSPAPDAPVKVRPAPGSVGSNGKPKPSDESVVRNCIALHAEKFKGPDAAQLKKDLADHKPISQETLDRVMRSCAKNGSLYSYNSIDSGDWLPATDGGRMPASENQSRMPAAASMSYSDVGRARTGSPSVDAGSNTAPREEGDESNEGNFAPMSTSGGEHSVRSCYTEDRPIYSKPAWQKFACRDEGMLNPDVCNEPHMLQSRVNVRECQSAIADYAKLTKQLDASQERLRSIEERLERMRDGDDQQSEDDRIIEEAAARKAARGSGRTGPTTGQALLSVGLGALVGGGIYALQNHSERGAYNNYLDSVNTQNDQLTSLGWQGVQPVPYRASGAAIGAGLAGFAGVTGAMLGSFGCGSQMYGAQMNPGIFGNPYAQSPYGQLGGGIFNAMPGAGAGYPGYGFGAGAGFGGGFGQTCGYQGPCPGQFGGGFGAFPGQGGFGGGFGAGAGFPGGFGGAGGFPGQFGGAGGFPGQFGGAGGFPGQFGGPGGFPGQFGGAGGFPGQFGGPGGFPGQSPYGNGYDQILRQQVNQGVGNPAQAQQLYGLIGQASQQLNTIGGSGYGLGGYGQSYPGYGYGSPQFGAGAGFGLSFGAGYGAGYGQSYPGYGYGAGAYGSSPYSSYQYASPYSVNPYATGAYSGSILSPSQTILPTTIDTTRTR